MFAKTHQKLRKYPRTYHFTWSEGAKNDDRILERDDIMAGMEIVVTEKLDGENTSMYNDWIHARSMDGKHHVSRNWVKALWGGICNDIPENMRICGENMFAEHSIRYDTLTSYFYVFGIYVDEVCLSWDDTVEYCKLFGLEHVPVLYRGPWDEAIVKACMTGESAFDGRQEGYVVRNVEAFPYDEFDKNCGKFVRKGHVQTDQNWMYQPVIPNGIIQGGPDV